METSKWKCLFLHRLWVPGGLVPKPGGGPHAEEEM